MHPISAHQTLQLSMTKNPKKSTSRLFGLAQKYRLFCTLAQIMGKNVESPSANIHSLRYVQGLWTSHVQSLQDGNRLYNEQHDVV